MAKFYNRAVRLGTLKPGDRFISVFSAVPAPPAKRVVGHFAGSTVYGVAGSLRTNTMPSSTPVFPEITNNEDTTTMNQQDTSVYYMVHNRTSGGSTSKCHSSYESAFEEASRLAKAYAGQDFVILKACRSVMVKAPEPTITVLS